MNILFVGCEYPPFIGGVAQALHRVACGMAGRNHEVTVVACDQFDATTPPEYVGIRKASVDGVQVYLLPISAFRTDGAAFGVDLVRNIAIQTQADIVHSYFFSMVGYLGQAAASSIGAPHVTSCRGNDCTQNILLNPERTRLVLRNSDHIIGVSRSMLQWASIVASGPPRTYVPNSISPEFFASGNCPREAARDTWRVADGDVALGAIVRPDWKKGIEYLHRLLLGIGSSDLPQLRFNLVGRLDSSLVEELRSSFLDHAPSGVRRTFEVYSPLSRDELPMWFAALDLFIMTSRREGMPNALLESLACGTPAAATAVDGIADVLQDEPAGLALDPFDADGAAKEILSLLKNAERLFRMRGFCRELIERKYLLQREIGDLLEIYHSLLD